MVRKAGWLALVGAGMIAALVAVSGASAAYVASRLDATKIVAGAAYALPSTTVFTEETRGDIGFGTIELLAPKGFAFDTSSPVEVVVANAKGAVCDGATALHVGFPPSSKTVVTPEPTKLTVMVSAPSRGRCTGSLSFSGITVIAQKAGLSGSVTLGGSSRIEGIPAGTALGKWASVAAGTGGTASAWGSNIYGEDGQGYSSNSVADPTVVQLPAGSLDVATGDWDTFAVLGDGTVWGWGMNAAGGLGDGTTVERDSPVQAQGVANATAVAAGWGHTLARLADGTVWSWGGNDGGQLGDGTTTGTPVPKQVAGLSGIVQIAAGRESSYALAKDGTLYGWGMNRQGELVTGDQAPRLTPTPILSGVASVAAGDYFVLVLKTDGTVWGGGSNDYGQLGIGAQTPPQLLAVQAQVPPATIIGAGDQSSFATTSDGAAWGWGANGRGGIGLGYTSEAVPTPTQIPSLSGVVEFAGGDSHTLARLADGSIWSFGSNYYGQLGVGFGTLGDTYSATPVKAQVSNVHALASREWHSVALSG